MTFVSSNGELGLSTALSGAIEQGKFIDIGKSDMSYDLYSHRLHEVKRKDEDASIDKRGHKIKSIKHTKRM